MTQERIFYHMSPKKLELFTVLRPSGKARPRNRKGLEFRRRSVGRLTPRRREQVPGADAKAKFDSLSAFATPAENPSEHRQHDNRSEPLIWIPRL